MTDSLPPAPRRWGLGRRKTRLMLYLAIFVAFAGLFHRFLFLGNFAVVDPGRVYRSAQPKRGLAALLRDHQIASVLNLRGGTPADWWYAEEVSTTAQRGVDFYDLPLSADRPPSRRELLQLLDLFGRCRYPLLIHCKSGSDRTGLAAAVYRMVVMGQSPEDALRAFTLWRGHVPLLGPERLHEPILAYARWLEERGERHTPERFRSWVVHRYAPDESPVPVRRLRPGPRAALAVAPSRLGR
jgi:hypothetical protein